MTTEIRPLNLDLQKDRGLDVEWSDGTRIFYPIAFLRKMSPAADNRKLQREIASNPLTVLPSNIADHEGPITAVDAKMVGNYALNITFSDGHKTGIYTWTYLRSIDPDQEGGPPRTPDEVQR